MRVNVKTDDTGTESIDWDHIDNVTDVDIRHEALRAHKESGRSERWNLDRIEYFHVTTIDSDE